MTSIKIENQAEHFCWNSWHMGGIERKAVAAPIYGKFVSKTKKYQEMYQLMTSIHTQFVTSSARVLHSIITLLTNTMTLAAMRSLLLQ